MRPGTYETHGACENIHQLRQFVKTRGAEESSKTSNARIILNLIERTDTRAALANKLLFECKRFFVSRIIGVSTVFPLHGAKLKQIKISAVPHSPCSVNNRTLRCEKKDKGYRNGYRKRQQEKKTRNKNIEETFRNSSPPIERRAFNLNDRNSRNVMHVNVVGKRIEKICGVIKPEVVRLAKL